MLSKIVPTFFMFQLKIKSEREHEEAQRERSKQQLEQAKQAGVEKLVSAS